MTIDRHIYKLSIMQTPQSVVLFGDTCEQWCFRDRRDNSRGKSAKTFSSLPSHRLQQVKSIGVSLANSCRREQSSKCSKALEKRRTADSIHINTDAHTHIHTYTHTAAAHLSSDGARIWKKFENRHSEWRVSGCTQTLAHTHRYKATLPH